LAIILILLAYSFYKLFINPHPEQTRGGRMKQDQNNTELPKFIEILHKRPDMLLRLEFDVALALMGATLL
jgi:hypothetical protein